MLLRPYVASGGRRTRRNNPAAYAALDGPGGEDRLLDGPRWPGAHEQATGLAGRVAAHASVDDPGALAIRLAELRRAGAHEQVTAMLRRDPAAHAALDDPGGVARLLDACGRRARTTS